MVTGGTSALVLIALSPAIMIDVLKLDHAIFPLRNPALISLPLAFAAGFVVSMLFPEPAAEQGFAAAERRMHLGSTAPSEPHRK